MKKTLLQQRLEGQIPFPRERPQSQNFIREERGEPTPEDENFQEQQFQSHDLPSSTFTLHGGSANSKKDNGLFMSNRSSKRQSTDGGEAPETARLGAHAQQTMSTTESGSFPNTALSIYPTDSSGFERDVTATNRLLLEQNFKPMKIQGRVGGEPQPVTAASVPVFQFSEIELRRNQPVRLSRRDKLQDSPILTKSPRQILEEYKSRKTPKAAEKRSPSRELIKKKIQKVTNLNLKLPEPATQSTSSLLSLIPSTVRDLSISRRCKADFDTKIDMHFRKLSVGGGNRDKLSMTKYSSEASLLKLEEPRVLAKQSLQHGTFFNISANKHFSPERQKQFRPPKAPQPRRITLSQKFSSTTDLSQNWAKTPSKRKVELQSELESAIRNFSTVSKNEPSLSPRDARSPYQLKYGDESTTATHEPSPPQNRTRSSFLGNFPSVVKEPKVSFSTPFTSSSRAQQFRTEHHQQLIPSPKNRGIQDVLGFEQIYLLSETLNCLTAQQARLLPYTYREEVKKLGELMVLKFGTHIELKREARNEPPQREKHITPLRGSPGSRQRE